MSSWSSTHVLSIVRAARAALAKIDRWAPATIADALGGVKHGEGRASAKVVMTVMRIAATGMKVRVSHLFLAFA